MHNLKLILGELSGEIQSVPLPRKSNIIFVGPFGSCRRSPRRASSRSQITSPVVPIRLSEIRNTFIQRKGWGGSKWGGNNNNKQRKQFQRASPLFFPPRMIAAKQRSELMDVGIWLRITVSLNLPSGLFS